MHYLLRGHDSVSRVCCLNGCVKMLVLSFKYYLVVFLSPKLLRPHVEDRSSGSLGKPHELPPANQLFPVRWLEHNELHLLLCFFCFWQTNHHLFVFVCVCLFAASPLMGAQSFPNLTTTGTTSTVTMSTSIVTSSNNVATATTGLSVGQLLSNTLTTSLTSTSSESDTGQEAEFSLYGWWPHSHSLTEPASANLCCLLSLI